jgi:hypothetical protein
MAPRQTIMHVLKRKTPTCPQLGALPEQLLPERGVPAPSPTLLQRLWGAVRMSLAWPVLAICLLPFWIYVSAVFVEQGRLALSVIVALWIFFRLLGRREGERRFVPSLAWTFAVFGIGILVFSAGNVFMKRYLLCLLPPLVILSSRALFELVRDQTKVLIPATMGLGLLCLGDLTSPRFNCAYDMSFRQSVLLQQEATQYLQNTVGPDKPILANFPTVFGLEDPRYGYTPEKFNRSSYRYSPEAEYIFASEIYDHFTPPAGVRTELMKRFSSPYMNIALYRILR